MMDSLAQQHPTVKKIRAEAFARATQGNHSKLFRTYKATAVEKDVFVGSRYVGRYPMFEPVHSRIEEEIRYITKGLSFEQSGRPILDDYRIDVFDVPQYYASKTLASMMASGGWKLAFRIGDLDEFVALRHDDEKVVEGGDRAEGWCFIFYRAVVFLAYVMNQSSYDWLKSQDGDILPAPVLGLDRP